MALQRITSAAMSRNVLADNQATLTRLATLQERLASGKRVNRVSDDPEAARQSLRLRVDDLKMEKYLDNIAKSQAFIEAGDTALASMSESLDSVKKLALQGANGTADAASRRAIARAVDSELTRLVDLANTAHDGRFLFAGTATTGESPFALQDGRVAYRGNLDEFAINVTPTSSETVNRNGHAMFLEGTDVFAQIIGLRDALTANDPAAVRDTLAGLDAAHGQVVDLHGGLGGQVRRLESARDQLESTRIAIQGLISRAENADLPSTIADLQLAETALEAGLQTGARLLQRSLLDYLQ
ncbi:MAG TPA: flagellar hook-associated protein FlgL [Planctomycetota bacterium]|nr:flagellar hook-associated protein FlgL [Planctomycetota bacterium]